MGSRLCGERKYDAYNDAARSSAALPRRPLPLLLPLLLLLRPSPSSPSSSSTSSSPSLRPLLPSSSLPSSPSSPLRLPLRPPRDDDDEEEDDEDPPIESTSQSSRASSVLSLSAPSRSSSMRPAPRGDMKSARPFALAVRPRWWWCEEAGGVSAAEGERKPFPRMPGVEAPAAPRTWLGEVCGVGVCVGVAGGGSSVTKVQ